MCVNISNIFYQVNAIARPLNNQHLMVNLIYTFFTVLSLILYKLSYYKRDLNFIFYAYAIVAVRTIIRLFDFE